MYEYPFDGFDPRGPHGGFVEMVEDIIGTDDVLVLTKHGEKCAVIVDADHYATLFAVAHNGCKPEETS
jgi:hypothetical protein